jgi:hypothetical protein
MIAHNLQEAGPDERARNAVFSPDTDLVRDEVRSQLQRILASPAFHNSKRYAAVLTYVVERTLEGYGDQLKERTIGIEVFKRRPDYDTSTDHAVRSAVAEVRKRLAQYYVNGCSGELRIELQLGSYMPQFRWVDEGPRYPAASSQFAPPTAPRAATPTAPTAAPTAAVPTAASGPSGHAPRKVWIRAAWIAAGSMFAVTLAVAWATILQARAPLNRFWQPVLSSRAPVLLCIGNVEGGQQPPIVDPGPLHDLTLAKFQNSAHTTVNEYDAFALARLASLLEARGKMFRLASQSDATFTDLQNGPAILVGLLNNSWTERLVDKLRFNVDQPLPGKFVIRDRNNPLKNDWSVDYSTPYLDLTKDYALVLRMVDPKTEQTVIVAAGVTVFGTAAAGNFLTSKNEMEKLAAIAPPGWEKKNMELVLSTDVIKGRSGPASIVAVQFW